MKILALKPLLAMMIGTSAVSGVAYGATEIANIQSEITKQEPITEQITPQINHRKVETEMKRIENANIPQSKQEGETLEQTTPSVGTQVKSIEAASPNTTTDTYQTTEELVVEPVEKPESQVKVANSQPKSNTTTVSKPTPAPKPAPKSILAPIPDTTPKQTPTLKPEPAPKPTPKPSLEETTLPKEEQLPVTADISKIPNVSGETAPVSNEFSE